MKKISKKNNFASNEAIKFFGSQRFLWVGWKGVFVICGGHPSSWGRQQAARSSYT
jgi:hypothetical protein